jgi:outer membrane receptor protein involved in Fe transport
LTTTLGLSIDSFEQFHTHVSKTNPKFGVEWNVTDYLTLRGAAFTTVKRALIADQTIEPTQVAGFDQFLDDINGTKASEYAGGIDWRIGGALTGIEVRHRDLEVLASESSFDGAAENSLYYYVYSTPTERISLTGSYTFDNFDNAHNVAVFVQPEHVTTHQVALGVNYFHPTGVFAGVGVTFVHQDVAMDSEVNSLPDGDSDFWLLDAGIGYRLPRRRGIVSLEGRNLLNQGFSYLDDNFRQSQLAPVAPFIPERTVIARVTLTF